MPWSVITMSQIGKSWKSVKIFPEQVLAQFCQELVQESERTQERDLTSHIGSLLNEVRQVFARKTWTTQWFHGISSVLEAKSIRTVRSWELWKSTKSRHPQTFNFNGQLWFQAGFVNVFEWHPTQQFWQARAVCPARRIESVVLDEGLQGQVFIFLRSIDWLFLALWTHWFLVFIVFF
jgi:hypothetical protein